ncbi:MULTISPECIES: methyl-accepting chemotaxis protein [unclassified Paenibacillus]|uniref:methyl-accepting chemotaxis protein n=1 Tax=unclassified Paenibacillus TaxID=185978 RepID=UPI0009A5B1A9|nr:MULTISPECIES: methyl-accepting chemotaxis protein [unclassified Paenibacillus]SLK22492.1 methyl-accepting chemotaxis protein [Paenibacillus sp. RU5A]SOC77206.1 methyl-accepting chemotaxis protein [Paenibacillus sp. RU26A]SOC78328.1 methyl-accepting chemotaxis protein [Paenibacillus sp. RU5M]
MKKHRTFKIFYKIGLGYLLVLAVLAGSILLIQNSISQLQRELDFLVDHDMKVHDLTYEIENIMVNMETGQRGYVITGQENYLDPYNTGVQQKNILKDQLAVLVSDNPAQQALLEKISAKMDDWIQIAGEPVIALRKANDMAAIRQFFVEDPGKKDMDEIRGLLNTFRTNELALTENRTEALKQKNKILNWELYGALIVVALISIFAALILSRSIVKNIRTVIRALNDIGSSNGDLTLRIATPMKDETRELAEAANTMLLGLQQMMLDVQSNATTLNAASDRLDKGVSDSHLAGKEVAAAMERVAEGADEQVALTQTMVAAMEQSLTGLNRVAGSASEVAERAVRTESIALDGQQRINNAVGKMGTIEQSFLSVQGAIHEISKMSDQVINIADSMSGIARQTNLLALNAGIEAARAGENGRGFAVVAGEIRNLADQSATSAKEITSILETVVAGIQSTVHEVEGSTQHVSEGLQTIEDAGQAFANITQHIQDLSAEMLDVSAVVEELTTGSEAVMTSINEVSAVVEDTASATEEVSAMTEEQLASLQEMADTSKQLNEMSDALDQLVNRFKLS